MKSNPTLISMIQPQITLQSYLHSETFNLGRHLEVTCNARCRFLDHWRTTFKRCSQSIASVRLLSPFRMSDFRTIAFALHLEHVSGEGLCLISFAWDPLSCSDQAGIVKFKMKIYISSGTRTHASPRHDRWICALDRSATTPWWWCVD